MRAREFLEILKKCQQSRETLIATMNSSLSTENRNEQSEQIEAQTSRFHHKIFLKEKWILMTNDSILPIKYKKSWKDRIQCLFQKCQSLWFFLIKNKGAFIQKILSDMRNRSHAQHKMESLSERKKH